MIILEENSLEIEARALSALANPRRLEILELLRDGEACVCHIQAVLGQRQALISQHLNVLRQAGLVTSRKDGLRVYYQVSSRRWFAVVDELGRALHEQGLLPAAPALDLEKRGQAHCTCPQCSERRMEQVEVQEVRRS